MFLEIVIKYIHFISIFSIVATLVAEYISLKPQLNKNQILFLVKVDRLYGISALLLLAAGLTLWFGVGKVSIFYSRNWIFIVKLILFLSIGLLSIRPTIFFLKSKKISDGEIVNVPKQIKQMILFQLIIIAIIPIAAILMARGIGYID